MVLFPYVNYKCGGEGIRGRFRGHNGGSEMPAAMIRIEPRRSPKQKNQEKIPVI